MNSIDLSRERNTWLGALRSLLAPTAGPWGHGAARGTPGLSALITRDTVCFRTRFRLLKMVEWMTMLAGDMTVAKDFEEFFASFNWTSKV